MDDAVGAYAAFAAFFIIISFFPFIMLLLALVQFLPFSAGEVYNYIAIFLPEAVLETLTPIFSELYNTSSAVISITAIAAIWSASKGIYALVCGLNTVYDVKETRNIIVVRAMSIFYTIVFLILIVACMGLLVFGEKLISLTEDYLPWMTGLGNIRYIIGLVVFVLFFLLIFRALPNRRSKLKDDLPGAVIAAMGWIVFSFLYSYYIAYFPSFPVIYGSIAAVVFMMLWLYFCMYITLLAAEINSIRQAKRAPYDIWKVEK